MVLEVPADLTASTPRAAKCSQSDIKTLLGGTSPLSSPVKKASGASPVGFATVETVSRQELGSAAQGLTMSKASDASPRPGPVPAASAETPAEECQPKTPQKPMAGPLLLPIQAVRSRREVAGFTSNRSDGGDAGAAVAAPAPQGTQAADAPSEVRQAGTEECIPELTRGKSAPSLLLPIQSVRSRRLAAERDTFGNGGGASNCEDPMVARTSTMSTCTRSTRRSVTFGATQFRNFVVESDGSESD